MAWITSTIDSDPETLEEMFWPTKEETELNKKLNKEAKEWIKNKRYLLKTYGNDIDGYKETRGSAFYSSFRSTINPDQE